MDLPADKTLFSHSPSSSRKKQSSGHSISKVNAKRVHQKSRKLEMNYKTWVGEVSVRTWPNPMFR